MSKFLLLFTLAGVLTGLCFFLVKSYGKSEYDRGYISAIAKVNEAALVKAKEKDHENKAVIGTSDADLAQRLRERANAKRGK